MSRYLLKSAFLLSSLVSSGLVAAAPRKVFTATQEWPVFEKDGKEAVVSAISQYISEAESLYPYKRNTAPMNWEDGVVYHIVTDRFNDGDVSRNKLNLPDIQVQETKNGSLRSLNDYRHGGDITGIRQRLDYLADLGVNVLWVTPVVKHIGTYHGYCTTDPTQIDPGFGTKEDFRDLVKDAHDRGMKVIMDIVVNHMCDDATKYEKETTNHTECAASLSAASWSGKASNGTHRGTLKFSPSFFGPLQSQQFYSRCGSNSESETGSPIPAAVFGDFTDGFFDYDTRNYDFQEIFTDLYKYWIAYADIDGFRADAAKHVTEDFVAHFSTHIRDYAQSLGKSDFYILGEIVGDVHWETRRLGRMNHDLATFKNTSDVPASLTTKIKQLAPVYTKHPSRKFPGLEAVYDFHMGTTMRKMILASDYKGGEVTDKDASPSGLEKYLSGDYKTLSSVGIDMKRAWMPLEIHDWPRLLRTHMGDLDKARKTAYLSAVWLMTMQGQPIIYYGFEQGFGGTCPSFNLSESPAQTHLLAACADNTYFGMAHSVSRQTMFASSGWRLRSIEPSIDSLAHIGLPSTNSSSTYDWKKDPYLNRNTFMYKLIRKLIRIRSSCEPLRRGETFIRTADDKGFLAYSRVSAAYEMVVLMNLNPDLAYSVNEKQISVGSNTKEGTRFINILNPSESAVTVGVNGTNFLSFSTKEKKLQVGPRAYALFVPEDRLGKFDTDIASHVCRN